MCSRFFATLILCLCFTGLAPNWANATAQANAAAPTNIGAGGRPVGQAWSRSPVYAAIAANAALGLMEPTGNGIGGDLFAIIWDPKTQRLHGLNASGRSPKSRNLEQLRQQLGGATRIPPVGHLPVTVPGTVDGWFQLHQRFGSLPMQSVLAPAIRYAKGGFPVSPVIAYYFQRAQAAFNRRIAMIDEFDNARHTYFQPRAPKAGEVFRNPDLGKTYAIIAQEGKDAFYLFL